MKTVGTKKDCFNRRLVTAGLLAVAGGVTLGARTAMGNPALALAVQNGSSARRALWCNPPVLMSGVPVSDQLPNPDFSSLDAGPTVHIASVVDGDTVELVRGPDVRLVGTQAPKLPLGRDHVQEWPLAQEAKQILAQLVAASGGADEPAQLYFGGRRTDRHGRHLAHVVLADGTWLQGAMVLAGLARVYTFGDNRSLIPDLLVREQVARHQKRHIWDHPYYQVRDAHNVDALSDLTNHFELIEGQIVSVAAHRERWYLNFGETWREDFTITIDREHDQVFESNHVNLHAFEGAYVRVRGWIMEDGGPLVRVDHPEQIEILRPAANR